MGVTLCLFFIRGNAGRTHSAPFTFAPAERDRSALRTDLEVAAALAEGAALAAVPLVRATGKPIRADLSIDADILRAIDAEARRRYITRSGLIELLARQALPHLS